MKILTKSIALALGLACLHSTSNSFDLTVVKEMKDEGYIDRILGKDPDTMQEIEKLTPKELTAFTNGFIEAGQSLASALYDLAEQEPNRVLKYGYSKLADQLFQDEVDTEVSIDSFIKLVERINNAIGELESNNKSPL